MKPKFCCSDSLAQGMDYCLQCGARLEPDETTLVAPRPTTPSHANRSLYFGMALVCLLVFGAIVTADYFVQRKAPQVVVPAIPSPTSLPVTQLLKPTPKPTEQATRVTKKAPKPSPSDELNLSDGLESDDPLNLNSGLVSESSSPTPTPRSTKQKRP